MADNIHEIYTDAWLRAVNTPASKEDAMYEQFVADHGKEAALLFIENPRHRVSPGVYFAEKDVSIFLKSIVKIDEHDFDDI